MSRVTAEVVGGNEDLNREILLRLPAKSVTRFKLVSKQWHSVISDPQFVQSHLLRRNPNKVPKAIFFCRSSVSSPKEVNFISFGDDGVPSSSSSCEVVASLSSFLDDILESTKISLRQSCNGLFLCRVYPSDLSLTKYCVFNPTTKQHRLLPQPREKYKSSDATLAFDPSVSLHYKVILMNLDFQGHYIYSSESQSWRFISYDGFQLPSGGITSFGHFFNGAIHWIGEKHSLCFDVYSEEMLQFKPGPGRGHRSIGDDGIHLHLVTADSPQGEDFFVLELSRDFSNWVNKYKVSASAFPELVVPGGHKISPFMALCVVKGVREEDSELLLKISGKLVSYNFMKKEVKTLCGLPSELDQTSLIDFSRAYPYMETLYSV